MNMEEREFNLWRFLEVLALRIRFIIIFVLLVTVVAVLVSLLLPRWYAAMTLLLPPTEEGINLGLSGSLDDIISLTAGIELPLMATPSDVYARILSSRSIAERVIEKHNLTEYLEIESPSDILEYFDAKSEFRVTPEGLLEITFHDRNPEMAATVANSFAEELDLMAQELSNSRARFAREFIENRLVDVSRELDSLRRAMGEFQRRHKAIDLDRQTQLAIQSAVDLKIELTRREIELHVKEKSLSSSHPDVITLRRRVDEIRRQIRELEFGGADSSYFSLPIADMPQIKVQLAELTSRLTVSEALFKILSEQYEQAKIQEQLNTPRVSILDRAYPPELAIRPQKRIIVAAAFFLSLIVAIMIVLFLNYLDRLKERSPEDYARFRFFYGTILGWIPGIRKADKNAK